MAAAANSTNGQFFALRSPYDFPLPQKRGALFRNVSLVFL
jgi:hypothetical protein